MIKLRVSILALLLAITILRLYNHQWWFGLGLIVQRFVDPYGNIQVIRNIGLRSNRRRQLSSDTVREYKPRDYKYFNLLNLITFRDPKTISFREQTINELTQHEGDALCIASVHNGEISAASIINEKGAFVNLALPPHYETEMNVNCTRTDQVTGVVATDTTNSNYKINRQVKSGVRAIDLDEFDCNTKSFQPGYYNHETNTWHDRCNGLQIDTNFRSVPSSTMFTPILNYGPCPLLDHRENDIWVSIIGDSVTRMILLNGLKWSKIEYKTWDPYGVLGFGNAETFIMAAVPTTTNQRIWFTFTFEFMTTEDGQVIIDNPPDHLVVDMPHTWGDFVTLRGQGIDINDPGFAMEKVPDTVIFNPGYHASDMNTQQFGENLNDVLVQWQQTIIERNLKAPPIHITLNMLPAPWMIPEKYADDRARRTELNEYRKNLAIIEVVQQHDFITSVLDFFSPELLFNGHEGDTIQTSKTYHEALPGRLSAHKDAVHLGGEWGLRVMIIAGKLMVNAMCNSG